MVKLANEDIKTRDVLDWEGLHVFHFPFSSCSQKLRIFLNLKGVKWKSHLVDLMGNENLTEHFLGINPPWPASDYCSQWRCAYRK